MAEQMRIMQEQIQAMQKQQQMQQQPAKPIQPVPAVPQLNEGLHTGDAPVLLLGALGQPVACSKPASLLPRQPTLHQVRLFLTTGPPTQGYPRSYRFTDQIQFDYHGKMV